MEREEYGEPEDYCYLVERLTYIDSLLTIRLNPLLDFPLDTLIVPNPLCNLVKLRRSSEQYIIHTMQETIIRVLCTTMCLSAAIFSQGWDSRLNDTTLLPLIKHELICAILYYLAKLL
jgi:hypothetical protein